MFRWVLINVLMITIIIDLIFSQGNSLYENICSTLKALRLKWYKDCSLGLFILNLIPGKFNYQFNQNSYYISDYLTNLQ